MINKSCAIYIHWPFCIKKCPYCDFNSHVMNIVDHDMWLISYKKEIEHFSYIIKGKYISSIFFGGGTPSLMEPSTIEAILQKISSYALIDKNTEITLEANPSSFEVEKFKQFKSAGINRISIGVQSLNNESLKFLGRAHDKNTAIYAVNKANQIFNRVSFDLIYARTSQTLKEWENELHEGMKLANGHISLYQLMIEKGTVFYKMFNEGNLTIPKSDLAADMYELTNEYLKSLSYEQYEISNYCKIGQECLHNLTYWNYETYLGIGPGAHSRIIENSKSRAIMMKHNPSSWLEMVNDIGHSTQSDHILTKDEMVTEIIMMGLRINNGISIKRLEQKTSLKLEEILNMRIINEYQEADLLIINDDIIKLTDKGLMLHNYIVARIIKPNI